MIQEESYQGSVSSESSSTSAKVGKTSVSKSRKTPAELKRQSRKSGAGSAVQKQTDSIARNKIQNSKRKIPVSIRDVSERSQTKLVVGESGLELDRSNTTRSVSAAKGSASRKRKISVSIVETLQTQEHDNTLNSRAKRNQSNSKQNDSKNDSARSLVSVNMSKDSSRNRSVKSVKQTNESADLSNKKQTAMDSLFFYNKSGHTSVNASKSTSDKTTNKTVDKKATKTKDRIKKKPRRTVVPSSEEEEENISVKDVLDLSGSVFKWQFPSLI